ncbi:MAG: 4-hydroxy-3-methylbut-2-enyl diphosphate reductase [Acidobacteria bacterium]|nr:4-hydroxy-3-methylbut-2-enyl diphosphate reductase [Acidobacteriota bacterium]MCG3192001.1 4-hydroxy-3-methylbut-2-enyl diphosphate reductase [Thermoanaerobaculia bacterium]MCK6685006.1 4-hydroxy-3-methylbut-2-enyl diphosphate reductase [Thermoanaerobaculia bacterium]
MEVVLAQKFGFCAGVRVADKLVRQAAAKGLSGAILGQVVHNESVEAEMARMGFPTVHELEEARKHDGRIVFSAHGVAPSVRDEAKSLGLATIDTTCKFVTDIHKEISRSLSAGAFIAILGQQNHREVIGYTHDLDPSRYRIFYELAEVKEFDWESHPKVKIIFQTTINAEHFSEHVAEIRGRVPEAQIADTICYATKENQDALRELCVDPAIDAIVVIGGRFSKNTKELALIAGEFKRTFLVGTAAELTAEQFAGMKKVGVSAGASTPDYDIEAVVETLRGF